MCCITSGERGRRLELGIATWHDEDAAVEPFLPFLEASFNVHRVAQCRGRCGVGDMADWMVGVGSGDRRSTRTDLNEARSGEDAVNRVHGYSFLG